MMKASSFGGAILIILVVVVAVGVAEAEISPSQCSQEKRLLQNACLPAVFGRPPSAHCCQLVRAAHVECVCPAVTTKLAAFIGVQRTIKKIEGCGRTVPRNFKCGSVTTPP